MTCVHLCDVQPCQLSVIFRCCYSYYSCSYFDEIMCIRSQMPLARIRLVIENQKQTEIVPTDHFVCIAIPLNDQGKHVKQIHGSTPTTSVSVHLKLEQNIRVEIMRMINSVSDERKHQRFATIITKNTLPINISTPRLKKPR